MRTLEIRITSTSKAGPLPGSCTRIKRILSMIYRGFTNPTLSELSL